MQTQFRAQRPGTRAPSQRAPYRLIYPGTVWYTPIELAEDTQPAQLSEQIAAVGCPVGEAPAAGGGKRVCSLPGPRLHNHLGPIAGACGHKAALEQRLATLLRTTARAPASCAILQARMKCEARRFAHPFPAAGSRALRGHPRGLKVMGSQDAGIVSNYCGPRDSAAGSFDWREGDLWGVVFMPLDGGAGAARAKKGGHSSTTEAQRAPAVSGRGKKPITGLAARPALAAHQAEPDQSRTEHGQRGRFRNVRGRCGESGGVRGFATARIVQGEDH